MTDPGGGGFEREGFALLEGFVATDELSALRREVDAVLARPLPPGCERPHNTLAPLRWDDPVVARLLGSRPRLAALARAAGASDLRWISAYVSVKDPRSGPLWWHQDWWCWDHPVSYRRAPAQVALLCYLDDTTAANGALRVLPGTHHRSLPLHELLPAAHARDADALDAHDAAMRDQPGQRTLDVRAGDAVVTDYRLLHGTHANTTAARRDCVLLSFAPSWRELPEELRAHLIRHPALPARSERAARRGPGARLLPDFAGAPRDLTLNRVAPAEFEVAAP